MDHDPQETILALTTDIVSAHVGNNVVGVADVPVLICQVYEALSGLGRPEIEPETVQEPAVPIRVSVKPDYIVCLEDGKKLKILRRYLRTRFDMSPEQYRAKWKLPDSYPMVAPNYTEQRRSLANAIGLGRKRAPEIAAEPVPEPRKRGRKPAARPVEA